MASPFCVHVIFSWPQIFTVQVLELDEGDLRAVSGHDAGQDLADVLVGHGDDADKDVNAVSTVSLAADTVIIIEERRRRLPSGHPVNLVRILQVPGTQVPESSAHEVCKEREKERQTFFF